MNTLSTKNAGKSLTKEKCDEICKLYESGVPAREIVEKYGIHRTTLPKIYKRYRGITRSLIPQVLNPRYFQTIDTHTKAYFVGFIAADGCIVDHSNTGGNDALAINILEKDRIVLDTLKDELQLEHQIYDIANKGQVALRVTHQQLCDDLKQYGLGYRKSLTMPNIFPLIPEEFRDSFALGYMDGDGCIYAKKTRYKSIKGYTRVYEGPSFSICGTPEFLLGFANHFGLKRITMVKNKSIHNLHINRLEDFSKVYFRLYANSPIWLERKKSVVYRFLQDQTISSSYFDEYEEELDARGPVIA